MLKRRPYDERITDLETAVSELKESRIADPIAARQRTPITYSPTLGGLGALQSSLVGFPFGALLGDVDVPPVPGTLEGAQNLAGRLAVGAQVTIRRALVAIGAIEINANSAPNALRRLFNAAIGQVEESIKMGTDALGLTGGAFDDALADVEAALDSFGDATTKLEALKKKLSDNNTDFTARRAELMAIAQQVKDHLLRVKIAVGKIT